MTIKDLSPYLFLLVLLGVLYFFPWSNINWGKLTWEQPRYITVQGYAESEKGNQLATFSAGINVINPDKDKAVQEVNTKITKLIEEVKKFGVDEKDIKTQSINIYQEEKWDQNTQTSSKGQWRVGNTVEVKLRDVERVSEFTSVLSNAGADNVWGPNFAVDNQSAMGDELLGKAVENAKSKADLVAKSMNSGLGQVISVTEGTNYGYGMPVMMAREASMGAGGGGGDVEAGTSTVSKTVTVVYEVK